MKLLKNRLIKNYLLLLVFTTAIEICFRLISSAVVFDIALLRIFVGLNIICLLLSFILSWLNTVIEKIINILVVFVVSFYAFLQLGFNNFIGVYMSINTSSQLGAVIDYIREFLASFLWQFYLIFIPFLLLIIYYIFIDKLINKLLTRNDKMFALKHQLSYEPLIRAISVVLIITLLCLGYYETLSNKKMQPKLQTVSNIELFRYPSVPSLAINQFGVLGFGILDIKSLYVEDDNDYVYISEDEKEDVVEETTDKSRIIDDTAWKILIERETNKKYNKINNYLINQDIPDYNDWTGLYKDKNIIIIMMESVNDIFINPELYPNFYKMYSEGIAFTNNYSPRNSCATGNNEFSGMTGLYTIQNNCTANVYRNNKYSEAIFNLFNNAGYKTSSMHDYTEAYYYRSTIHKNLGSMKYYGVQALKIPYSYEYVSWASDEDFMAKAMDITLEDTSVPFMLWLTTVSGHQPYSVSSKEGDLYLDMTKDSGLPKDLRRYMSKLKILDNGLGVLLERLENAGILDDTVIILYGDHYPYGLKKDTISKVLDYDLSEYEVERVPLVIYNSVTPSIKVEKYTSYINLTPTIANLFGLDYDPRLYMGTDVLSDDYLNVVTFADGSWKNNIAYYNASKANIKYYTDEILSDEEIMHINNVVTTKMQISKDIIHSNYFDYLDKKLKSIKEELEQASNQELD